MKKQKKTHKIIDLEPISELDEKFCNQIKSEKFASIIWALCSGFVTINALTSTADFLQEHTMDGSTTALLTFLTLFHAGIVALDTYLAISHVKKYNRLNNIYTKKKEIEQGYRDKGYSDGQLLFLDEQLYRELIEEQNQKQ